MRVLLPVFAAFWKKTAADDGKRMAGQFPPEGITEVLDLPYMNDGEPLHRLDVYYPTEHEEKLPVIIDIHGGGWMYGDKELNKNYNLHLASRGYLVFSMSYTLVPKSDVPTQLREIAQSFAWIDRHMEEYPCDRSRILLTGDSAGGQLALYSAVLLNSSVLRSVFSVKDCGLEITCLALTSPVPYMRGDFPVSVYGKGMWGKNPASLPTARYMDFDDIARFASLPPTYLVTSSGDTPARKQTRRAYEKIKSLGVKTELKDWEKFKGKNLPHVFSVLDPESEEGAKAISDMLAFFEAAPAVKLKAAAVK